MSPAPRRIEDSRDLSELRRGSSAARQSLPGVRLGRADRLVRRRGRRQPRFAGGGVRLRRIRQTRIRRKETGTAWHCLVLVGGGDRFVAPLCASFYLAPMIFLKFVLVLRPRPRARTIAPEFEDEGRGFCSSRIATVVCLMSALLVSALRA